MRHDSLRHRDTFGNLRHPVEAYASGEFTIVWVETDKGLIAARCVHTDASHAPIYGVCEKSMDMIQEYLSANRIEDDDWTGYSLLSIKADEGGFIAPYLDLSPQNLSESTCGTLLTIEHGGEIDASDYSGILNIGGTCTCQNCNARMHEDESFCVDEMSVCESCYEDSHYCERYEESTFESVQVVFSWSTRSNRSHTQYWCESAIESYAEYVDGEYWNSDDLLSDSNGDYVTPKQLLDGEYFESEWDGELYPASDMCELSTGECVARGELTDSWQQGSNGIWHDIQLPLELESKAA